MADMLIGNTGAGITGDVNFQIADTCTGIADTGELTKKPVQSSTTIVYMLPR
jgi:hypothetical protein